MKSKITPEARARCAAHSLHEQLAQLRAIHALELALLEKRQAKDLEVAEVDGSWSGQYARLSAGMPKEPQ